MDKFVRNLITEWRRLDLPFSGETIVVAVSGGADSLSLLLGIHDLTKRRKLNLRIVAAHFDHKLRGDESGNELKLVQKIAAIRQIDFVVGEWKRTTKGNLEQDARRARYEFLEQIAKNEKARFVLTGHNMNDQAETVLMNLIRGAGIDGLGGMHAIRTTQSEIVIVRPMLGWAARQDTENFCQKNSVKFALDPMNDDILFRRVWIRKKLLPMIEQVNPKIVDSLCRTANLLQQKADSIMSVSGEIQTTKQPQIDLNSTSIPLKELKSLQKPELRNSIRLWLKTNRGNLRGLQLKHFEAIEQLVHSRKSGKFAELPGKATVIKQAGQLMYINIKVDN